MSRLSRSRVQRRNTMDCAILNQMFVDEESKRIDKRAQALLRESERDLKHSMTTASATNYKKLSSYVASSDRIEESAITKILRTSVPTLVESCNRYMSVSSRPVGCRSSAPPLSFCQMQCKLDAADSPKLICRKQFHETFANLIKLGSIDRQEKQVNLHHNVN